MRTVIFDLDGTLADTSKDLIAAANACFLRMGHGEMLHPDRDAATAFRGGRAMLRLGMERLGRDPAEANGQYQYLLECYEEGIDTHTVLYPGAAKAVERLSEEGFRVGICTNKPAALAELLLQRLGVRNLFGSMIGADTLPVRKPDPAPYIAAVEGCGGRLDRSLLVGDTVTDRETARAAGVPCVLVTFGPDGQGVDVLEPEALLHGYDGLAEVANRLLPA